MPPSIIAIDANNHSHVYSRQTLPNEMMGIPALIEVSANTARSKPTNRKLDSTNKTNYKQQKPKKSLSVSVHMPVPLTRVDFSVSSFQSLDGLSSRGNLLRDSLKDPVRSLMKRQVLERQLVDLKDRMKQRRKRVVRFATPEVTQVHTRPYTELDEIATLFYQEEELDQFEEDRYMTPGDVVECAFVEEAYAIRVAYQRRASVDD